MLFLIFLVKYFLLLMAASFTIVSFYKITRGQKAVMPNGKIVNDGAIFGFWQRYFERIKRYDKVYYNDAEVEKVLIELEYMKPVLAKKIIKDAKRDSAIICDLKENEIIEIEKLMHLRFRKPQFTENVYYLYGEYPVFAFPEIIRNQLSSCVRCMGVPFGTLFYVLICYFDKGLFDWNFNNFFAYLFFWFTFILSLGELNVFWYSKSKF